MSDIAYVIGAYDEAKDQEVYFRWDHPIQDFSVVTRLAKSSILFEEPGEKILEGVQRRLPGYAWRVCRIEMRVVGTK